MTDTGLELNAGKTEVLLYESVPLAAKNLPNVDTLLFEINGAEIPARKELQYMSV